jgi:hypothetical protein
MWPTFVLPKTKRDIPSDRRLSPKLMPTFADRGCRVVSATDPHGRILGFLDPFMVYNILFIFDPGF